MCAVEACVSVQTHNNQLLLLLLWMLSWQVRDDHDEVQVESQQRQNAMVLPIHRARLPPKHSGIAVQH